MKEPTKPTISDSQRGIGVAELIFTIATLGAAVLVGAMGGPKLPPLQCD